MNGKKDMILEWVRLADLDLLTANHMLAHHPVPIEIICFHAQQAGEKMLKYFLVTKNIEPPKIHDLQILLEMCIKFDSGFSALSKESVVLTPYGVMPRYPADHDIDEHDAEAAIKCANKIRDFVNGIVSTDS